MNPTIKYFKFTDREQAESVLFTVVPAEYQTQSVLVKDAVYNQDGFEIEPAEFQQQEVMIQSERLEPKLPNIFLRGLVMRTTGQTHIVTLGPGYEVEAPVTEPVPGFFVDIIINGDQDTSWLDQYKIDALPED